MPQHGPARVHNLFDDVKHGRVGFLQMRRQDLDRDDGCQQSRRRSRLSLSPPRNAHAVAHRRAPTIRTSRRRHSSRPSTASASVGASVGAQRARHCGGRRWTWPAETARSLRRQQRVTKARGREKGGGGKCTDQRLCLESHLSHPSISRSEDGGAILRRVESFISQFSKGVRIVEVGGVRHMPHVTCPSTLKTPPQKFPPQHFSLFPHQLQLGMMSTLRGSPLSLPPSRAPGSSQSG